MKGVPVQEVYKHVDAHMTDSTEHNKGFNKILQDMYGLENPAGQIFCGTHTTLGFSSALNKTTRLFETDMGVEHLVGGFMVGMEVDSKNSSIAGQSLDMRLKLVAPEYSHKPWNYCNLFKSFIEREKLPMILFAYKDQRFGCMSRAAGVLLFYYDQLSEFLSQNPQICNRLACLVREVINLPYLKVVFAVFAIFGLHLIEPFYAKTIAKGSTHSSLKKFYKELHSSMGNAVTDEFVLLTKPCLGGISEDLFKEVKMSYGEDIVDAVAQVVSDNTDEVIKLANLMLPELRTVLARQRRDYGLDQENFPAQFPVENQAANIDDTPVHNIGMERFCGLVDYRLKKMGTLSSVSRSMILG